jgi:hypothetical protein
LSLKHSATNASMKRAKIKCAPLPYRISKKLLLWLLRAQNVATNLPKPKSLEL